MQKINQITQRLDHVAKHCELHSRVYTLEQQQVSLVIPCPVFSAAQGEVSRDVPQRSVLLDPCFG